MRISGDSGIPPLRSENRKDEFLPATPALAECNGAKCRNLTPSRLRADSGIPPLHSENRNDRKGEKIGMKEKGGNQDEGKGKETGRVERAGNFKPAMLFFHSGLDLYPLGSQQHLNGKAQADLAPYQ